jgi:DNA-binding transcriptional MerR regulator
MKTIYLLKDLSLKSGFSIYTIKFYLKMGLIKEIGRSPDTNFRYFDDTTVKKLAKIRRLRKKKLPISAIRKTLKGSLI